MWKTKGIASYKWHPNCLGTLASKIVDWIKTLVYIKPPWAPIKQSPTFASTFFLFHPFPLHILGMTIDARMAWTIIMAAYEIIYYAYSKSSCERTFDWKTSIIVYALPNNTILMKKYLFIWDCAFRHIQILTPTPMVFNTPIRFVFKCAHVVGGAPKFHAIRKFGSNLRHPYGLNTNLTCT